MQYQSQAKRLFRQLSDSSPTRCSLETDQYMFHYLIERGVCYLTMAERGYPRKLAFDYLEELEREFNASYGSEVETAARPYSFIKFDTVIQRTKRQYQDTRAQRNLSKLNEDLGDIHRILTKNIQDVLQRGEKLETVSNMGSVLASESKKYRKTAKQLNMAAIWQQYGPPVVVLSIVSALLYLRFVWFV